MSGGGIISTLILVLPHLFYPCAAALPHPSTKEDAFCLLPPSKQGLLSFQVYSNLLNDLWQRPHMPLPWPCCRRAFLEYFWILGAKWGCTKADWLRARSSFLFHVCGMCWRDAHQLSLAVWDEGQPVKQAKDFGCWHHEENKEYCNGKATMNCFECTAALRKAHRSQNVFQILWIKTSS